MGNVSSVRDVEEEWQQQEREGQGFSSHSQGGSEDLMRKSPPQSPRGVERSPLLFTPQIPMIPLQRLEEMHWASDLWMQNFTEYENVIYDQGIPTMITWNHGGKEVFVEGSWDNWKTKYWGLVTDLSYICNIYCSLFRMNRSLKRLSNSCTYGFYCYRKPLQKSGKDFTIVKVLPSGFYQYRFIVDGEWRYAPDIPWMHDDLGNAYNILDLKEFVPEDIESIAAFEPPQSPDSTYNGWPLGSEDFAKEPPSVPPHLYLTLLNKPANMDSPFSLSRPPHVMLNHLYIQKGKSGQPVVALGATCRFRSKYVTVVLYKSSQL
ncbi:SNF1-related protein kinase regulatory subunit beta-2 isoform X1 [Elaeis guineensis]|uniref:SNF1-related protein kinase regulatory subunit beta-2 isoform X2 n=1 Tax=Elaeis guineensis var. tenera TaxID=51953 RepID=A0A6I9S967_ELAGV|nr:SNF1-related protein kinase regulatory subunit beta-2 isoform X2 [Elaeis guineensis]XP_010939228.1 SNF1-related protein kinase regulatory subunit beta-2 isoform X2 [Elaeis guineensis]XP_010939229.1 SNF1-related protein kinase regulatory subunit beta-2 isoform X2 [Elaeis guineensis]XP_029124218.1 SNF1-related protein kinase regulatory subunit beta-2 isoform X2 [Elaeis guineensis]